MKLNLLNAILLKLQKAIQRMDRKLEQNDSPIHAEKKKGLEELLEKFRMLKDEIQNNPQVVHFDRSELSRKIKETLNQQKQKTPLLSSGLFSKNRWLLNTIEKEALRQDRDYINPA